MKRAPRTPLGRTKHWAEQALAEVRLARLYLERQYSGPEHEALQWAQQFLENALAAKAVTK